jgi:hypothetical protein
MVNHELFADNTVSNEGIATPIPSESDLQIDFSQFNPYGVDSLYDAWFSQHVANLGNMNPTQMHL